MIIAAILMPLAACLLCFLFRHFENIRDFGIFLVALATFYFVFIAVGNNALENFDFAYAIIVFQIEPLGATFALLASFLWILTHIYAIGYMRANKEKNQNVFFACFAFAIFATIGIAFAANLITLFIFYELLTLATYPLVIHKQTPEAKKSGRLYLAIVMGASVIFFLPAIVWTFTLNNGNLSFTQDTIITPFFGMPILFLLFLFGLAKGAIMPLHRWLPAAMVAPTPVSALLHAVAVVKAGVFAILKIAIYIFGIETLRQSATLPIVGSIAAASILIASIIAIGKDDLKARLAFSTISQLAYITLGLAMATTFGILGAALHIITHAFGKITLFMCAGNIYTAHHKQKISQMNGLGAAMPITFIAFAIGAISIIGLPPLAGAWSKGILMLGASQQPIFIAVLAISTLLNIFYLTPIFAKAFFNEKQAKQKINEAPLLCIIPPCITAIGCLLVFIFANDIIEFLMPISQTLQSETN